MYEKILIPLDLAEGAPVHDLVAIARCLGQEGTVYTFLHVIEDIPAYIAQEIPGDVLDGVRREVEARLREIKLESGLPGEVVVRKGHPSTVILDEIEERGHDCVVMGSHRPGFADLLLGSTAARVVRHAPCSVHVHRPAAAS